jgi:sporulation protein YlmC with PRC-barrel domain
MSPAAEFDIGSEVACSDGVCGTLSRLVVDPGTQAVTHLVVEPRHHRPKGHLVPIRFVTSAGKRIELSCTRAQFEVFEAAEEIETDYLPGGQDIIGGDSVVMPYGALRPATMPVSVLRPGAGARTEDRVPSGEVDVRRGEAVHATDGEIGRIEGLVITPDDHHVTHILLQEGHLWGRKQVAIPIGSVTRVGDTISLKLSKDEVRDLPAIDVDHPVA